MIRELFFVVLSMICCNALSSTEDYALSLEFKNGNVKLYWNYTSTHITFEVHGKTLGWVGIGFSPNGAMTGADIVVGWVKNGEIVITDRYGDGNTFPPKDPVQNIEILGGFESEGWTILKFRRQLASCEDMYDRDITQGTQRLIWALGPSDPIGGDLEEAQYHGMNRGGKSAYILESLDKPSDKLPVGPVYETFDVKTENFSLPPMKTYYNCRIVKLPNMSGKHHIVKAEPLIQDGAELNVHHIIISTCLDFKKIDAVGKDFSCRATTGGRTFPSCLTYLMGWAVGGGPFIYPPETGYPIGEPGSPEYLMIETHYDNPELASDLVDSSGIRLTYTSTLRKYDSGILGIGNIVDGARHFIPPGAEKFTTAVICDGSCLKNSMEASAISDVKVFATLLHTHLAGRSIKVHHYRDGVELPYIDYDPSYNFNFQEMRHMRPPIVVTPNDILRLDCTYNTEGRSQMTEGGEGTEQEMCLAFFGYYPRMDLAMCLSATSKKESWPYFGIYNASRSGLSLNDYNVTDPPNLSGQTAMQVMSSFNWTRENIEKFEKDYMEMTQTQYCVPGNASQVVLEHHKIPKITPEYVPPTLQCPSDEDRNASPSRLKENNFVWISLLLYLLMNLH